MHADETKLEDTQPPAATEQIHLPGPSYLPVLVALGITISLVGILITWPVIVIGVVIFLIPAVRWIRQTRREMSRLPLDH
jgi:hypothetical protein